MYGTLDNPQYKLDKEEKKIERKIKRKEENTNLKSILKQEFGLFKKDTSVKMPTVQKKPATIFEVEFV